MNSPVLVQLAAPSLSPALCSGWSNVATTVPIQLAIVSDATAAPAVARASRDLYDAINALVQACGAIASNPPCGGGGPAP